MLFSWSYLLSCIIYNLYNLCRTFCQTLQCTDDITFANKHNVYNAIEYFTIKYNVSRKHHYIISCTMYNVHCKQCSVQCTTYYVQCIRTTQYTKHSVSLIIVGWTMYFVSKQLKMELTVWTYTQSTRASRFVSGSERARERETIIILW